VALVNLMMPGSYTVVDQVQYSKHNREVHILVAVFTDATKTQMCATLRYHVNGRWTSPEVVVEPANTPPENPSTTVKYMVGPSPVGEWQGCAGRLVEWTGNSWSSMASNGTVQEAIPLWDEVGQRFVVWVGNVLVPIQAAEGRVFDRYFSSAIVGEKGILGAAYDYLKSKPEIFGTTDA
jgi:hypothetical protein